jgi:acetyl-CoA synthetase
MPVTSRSWSWRRTGAEVRWAGRDLWYDGADGQGSADCPPEADGRGGSAVHPLHLRLDRKAQGRAAHHRRLSGLGVLTHAAACSTTATEGEVYWCTADVGWVTGHSYIVYGPLANGATTLMFEGVPNYPDPGRFWEVVDKHKVTIFYTAPTAIRALMREGDQCR